VTAYHNSFAGAFVFDDIDAITENPHIRSLWPITHAAAAPPETTVSGRPLVSLSLALNYRISKLDVWSYHALNLAVHALAGMVLFGLVRRTLLSRHLRQRFGADSWLLALVCAVLWTVHPLQTQAVTYVVQRAESMMGLFYLLTLYCAARAFSSRRGRPWQVAAVVFCAAGMATKEVMVTAPVVVFIYDRIFLARSFGETFWRRWRFYAALAGTWAILAVLVLAEPRGSSAGLGLPIGPIGYAKAQCFSILHYIRLAFWPDVLVLDYGRAPSRTWAQVAPAAAAVAGLLLIVGLALRFRPTAGFLGTWFFVILAPTSSFVPINDVTFEHRMYLPLAAIIADAVLATYLVGGWALRAAISSPARRRLAGRLLACALAAGVAAPLAAKTVRRNRDYRSRIAIWQDTALKRPLSRRAHCSLGAAYRNAGQFDKAIECYDRAIKLSPKYSLAYNNRGIAYAEKGMYERAIADFDVAIKLRPNFELAYANRGAAYVAKGDYARAIRDLDAAIRLNPKYTTAHENKAIALAEMRKARKASKD